MIIYLLILLLLFFGIVLYDVLNYRNYVNSFTFGFFVVLTLVSGFSYRLGGDGIAYVKEFGQYGNLLDVNCSYLFSFQGRMPGWVLLSTFCKTICPSYVFFKFVHAALVNYAYIRVIKENTCYVFTGILLYFILIYFNQNFQILRESIAISFLFFSLPYFYSNNWKKYYFFVLIAFSFHEGAAFLLFLPLVKLLGINKFSITFYILLNLLLFKYASDLLLMIIGIKVDGDLQGKISSYTSGMDSQYDFNFFGNIVLNILIPVTLLTYYKLNKIDLKYFYPALIGVLLYPISLVVPIAYRLGNYFLIFNFLLISDFVIGFSKVYLSRWYIQLLFAYTIVFSFIVFKSRMYLLGYDGTDIPSYVQYYPYSSVFDQYMDPDRERLYKYCD